MKQYAPGSEIELAGEARGHLSSQCLPRHYDDSGALQLAVLEAPGQAIASAPVVCELCHVGLSDWNALAHHCEQFHFSWAEARKVVYHRAGKMGVAPLRFAFFRRFSGSSTVPKSICSPSQTAKQPWPIISIMGIRRHSIVGTMAITMPRKPLSASASTVDTLMQTPYSCTTGISVLVQRTKSTICCMPTGTRNGGL